MKSAIPKKFPKKEDTQETIKTLLVDGNALFKVGFVGAINEYNSDGLRIGGIYQFLTVVRKLLSETVYHKCFVFWDGKFSGKMRYEIYKDYKKDRGKDYINGTVPDDPNYLVQQERTISYLDTFFIKQLIDEIVEGDDLIAYYCQQYQNKEQITVCTNDSDMYQLISKNVRIYNCGANKKFFINEENYFSITQHHKDNTKLIKVISGDSSDSIKGIKGVKEKTLLTNFPRLCTEKVTLEEIIQEAKDIQAERAIKKKKPLIALDNIINGVTDGIQDDVYKVNNRLVDLLDPMITEEAKDTLNFLKTHQMSGDNRGIKEALRMMKEDKVYNIITDRNIEEYLLPFKKYLERKKDNY